MIQRAQLIRKMAVILLCALFAAGCTSTDLRTSATAEKARLNKTIEKAFPSLVRIYVVVPSSKGGRLEKMVVAGSGAIIRSDGYIVTNHHVAGDATQIVCTLAGHDQIEYDADLVGTDPMLDIAVIKLKPNASSRQTFEAMTWGDSDAVRVGDTVLALGSPMALSQTVTRGIVSNVDMIQPEMFGGRLKLSGEDVGAVVRWIAHDATIFGGNSGGPLVNGNGEIIGINEIGIAGLGGAIPSKLARKAVEDIIAFGHVQRSWFGIDLQPRLKNQRSLQGALVSGVIKGSPAEAADIRAGDFLTAANGQMIDAAINEEIPPCNITLMSMPAGTPCTLTIIRDGKTLTKMVSPESWDKAVRKPVELIDWGMVCRDLSKMMILTRSLGTQDGVSVVSVRQSRAAAEARPAIEKKDVILSVDGIPVKTVTDLQRVTEQLLKSGDNKEILVELERNKARYFSVVSLSNTRTEHKSAMARKAWLPINTQVLTKELCNALSLSKTCGVRVIKVKRDYAGDDYPLKVGDLILAIDGVQVDARREEDDDIFRTSIQAYPIGETVALSILRDGKTLTVDLPLMPSPPVASELDTYEDLFLGFSVRDLGAVEDSLHRQNGVKVTDVESGSWAFLGGLQSNDCLISVNGEDIASVGDVKERMATLKDQEVERILLFVERGIRSKYLEIEPKWNNQ